MNLKGKNFYTTADLSQNELNYLIDTALNFKKRGAHQMLIGKSLAMLFFNPSLRTRLSFASAMNKLGGSAFDIPADGKNIYTFEFEENTVMDKDTKEHVKEAARVVSSYCNSVAIRASHLITNSSKKKTSCNWDYLKKDLMIKNFMKYSTVPVINMESNMWHPCQGLDDGLTIKEKIKIPKGKKYVLTWAYHPKALPVATPHSQILAACDLGMDVTVAYPKEWDLDHNVMDIAAKRANESGGNLNISNDIEKSFKNADVICAKSWGSLKYYNDLEIELSKRSKFKNWIVDKQKMDLTNNAYFMHCLPVRRNVVVTDEVLDSKNSIIIDQAENRMWAQMALLSEIIL